MWRSGRSSMTSARAQGACGHREGRLFTRREVSKRLLRDGALLPTASGRWPVAGVQ